MTVPAAPDTATDVLLDIKDLRKYFPIRGGIFSKIVANVKAVQDISFTVGTGEVVGLVGESGSGKTTAGRSILRLIEPTSGEIMFRGTDIAKIAQGKIARIPQGDADNFSGSVCLTQSPNVCRGHHR